METVYVLLTRDLYNNPVIMVSTMRKEVEDYMQGFHHEKQKKMYIVECPLFKGVNPFNEGLFN